MKESLSVASLNISAPTAISKSMPSDTINDIAEDGSSLLLDILYFANDLGGDIDCVILEQRMDQPRVRV